MEQNEAEVNQKLNVHSRNQEQEKSVTQLRSKISLSNFQMLQLTHNDQKFTDRIFELNQKGINSIQLGNYEEALLYLGEAQKLLQYAASCGRALDRQIILKILNNEAVIYQKTWDLQRSISYIEAIIFNLQTFLNSKQNTDTVEGLKQKMSQIQNSSFQEEDLEWFIESQFDRIKSIISKKYQLSLYYLQFSCLNSQNQDHDIGLNQAHEALKCFKQSFSLSYMFFRLKKLINIEYDQQSLKLLESVTKIQQSKTQDFQKMIRTVQQIQKIFETKSHAPSSFNFILQKYSSLQKKQAKYKNFSLTSVMQLNPKSFGDKMILDQSKIVQGNFHIEDIEKSSLLTQKILQFAVTYFTISVEIKQLNHQSSTSPNMSPDYVKLCEQEYKKKAKQAQMYYIISLKLSVQIVEELSQFSRYTYKNYIELYNQQNIKISTQSMSKMDSLKEKYKKYLPNEQNNINMKHIHQSDEQFCDNTISEYSINIKLSTALNPKDSKQNKLEKFFKQNAISTPQNTTNHAPPRLNIDLSQIQSVEYGGSKTFKQNNEVSHKIQPQQVIQEEEQDNKQTKKLNCLNIKKIKTVPNLSDVSSNQESESISKQKSQISKKSKRQKQNKSKRKSPLKQTQSKKNIKLISATSRQKPQIKKFVSPKSINRKSHQANTSTQANLTEGKAKTVLAEKKVFSDRKIYVNTQKQNEKVKKQKKLLVFKQNKKKKDEIITPQPSNRNVSQRDEINKNLKQERPRQTKKISKLRKAKSFQQVIHPYEDIKPIIYQSRDISNTYNIYQKPKLKQKLKFIAQSKKTKSTQNLKFTVKTGKKEPKKSSKLQVLHQNLSQNNQARQLLETKNSAIKKKRKSNSNVKETQYHSSIAWQQNAVRMSSVSNLMNSANEKQALRKLNSSKSLHESNYSSGYLLKGFNINASQRTKADSIAMTKSLKKK